MSVEDFTEQSNEDSIEEVKAPAPKEPSPEQKAEIARWVAEAWGFPMYKRKLTPILVSC